jgi:hypothetical protein
MDPCGSLGLGWLNGIFLAEYMTTITELYLSPNGDAINGGCHFDYIGYKRLSENKRFRNHR